MRPAISSGLDFAARAVVAVLLLLAIPRGASGDANEARRHYEKAVTAYNLQKFAVALEEFQAAYVERQDPVFLFNIAQTQRNLGQYEAASKSYRAFLNQAPDTPGSNRGEIERLIQQMDSAAKDARAKEQATVEQHALPPRPETPSVAAAPSPANAPSSPAASAPPRAWYKNTAGMALLAGGIVAAGIGGGLLGVGLNDEHEAKNAPSLPTQRGLDASAHSFQPAGIALLGVGGTAVVVGSIVLAVKSRRTTEAAR